MAILNGLLVASFMLRVSITFIISGFFILEILRFTMMTFISLIYASAASKNLLDKQTRQITILGAVAVYMISAGFMMHVGLKIIDELMTVRNFAIKLCLDPQVMLLKVP